jgi:TonB family protein
MYQRGTSSTGSHLASSTLALLVVCALFIVIPWINRMERWGSPSISGEGLITTAPLTTRETQADTSIAVRNQRMNLADRGTVLSGWTQDRARPEVRSRVMPMPILEDFEPAEKVETEFVFNVADLDHTPTPYFRERPVYPVSMRREAMEGTVVAEFRVDREGRTWDVVIISSDHPEFSASVADALKRWRTG